GRSRASVSRTVSEGSHARLVVQRAVRHGDVRVPGGEVTGMTRTTRREFVRRAGASAAAVLLSGVPRGWTGAAYAGDGPEVADIRFGIIALTDCAPIVIAHELGYFKKFGINSTISKEASWAVIRDKLSLGENQATHMLFGMPLASTMGLAGSPVKPMVIPWLLNRNGQAITLNNKLKAAGAETPPQATPIPEKA